MKTGLHWLMASFDHKTKLFKGLLTGEAAYTGPLFVAVDIAQRCNLQCLACICHSPHSNSYLKGAEYIGYAFPFDRAAL